MFKRLVILATLLFLPVASLAQAGLEAGKAAYLRGDYATAYKEIKGEAEQGDPDAQNNLGLLYDKGQGVPQNYAEAVKWYRKAAEQGYAPAQNNLGVMYHDGKGVPQDFVLAHMWFNLAAAQGNLEAKKNRDVIAERMTPNQIAEAQHMAREWKPKVQDR